MKVKNRYWLAAGIINIATALIHTIAGQITLVDPLWTSNLSAQVQTEWLGVWHMQTAFLWLTSYYIISTTFNATTTVPNELIRFIGVSYMIFGAVFILVSLVSFILAPQWILLLAIGVLLLIGIRKTK